MNNLLYAFYIVVVLIFGYGQTMQMLESTQGVILSMFLANLFFVFYMFYKSWNVYIDNKTVESAKVLAIYSLGVLLYFILSIVFVLKQIDEPWQIYDTVNVWILIFVFIVVYFMVDIKVVKNISGAIVKSIPQLTFAIAIWFEGNLGVSWEMILAFHILTIPRVYGTWKQYIDDKENIDKKYMFLAEFSNEGSWIIVTLAFLTT